MNRLFFVILLSTLVYAEAIDLRTCRPVPHRGIGVGNNNYKGNGCLVPVERVHVEAEAPSRSTTVIIVREPAHAPVLDEKPLVEPLVDYGD
jgi:hypothetical protein